MGPSHRHAGGPGIGWQDLRTVGTCLELQADGIRLAPNASATKLAALLDMADPDRSRERRGELCFGTVDTWVAWTLRGGRPCTSPTPPTPAITGLIRTDASGWDPAILAALRIPTAILPTIVHSTGVVGAGHRPGRAPRSIAGIAGDQQASLFGQGCTRPGLAKATFGTGGMLDLCIGDHPAALQPPGRRRHLPHRHLEQREDAGLGSRGGDAVGRLVRGMAARRPRHHRHRRGLGRGGRRCEDTGDVWFVPALLGLGAPVWDFGARGSSSASPGAPGDPRWCGRPGRRRRPRRGPARGGRGRLAACPSRPLRVDGGMSANDVFVQALADACGRPIEISPVLEATTLGAAYLAGMAVGIWSDENEVAEAWSPRRVVDPGLTDEEQAARRERWLRARAAVPGTIPELSALDF